MTRTKRTKICYGFYQERASKGVFVVDNNSWFYSKSLGRTSEIESTKVARPFLDENLVKKTHYCQTQDGTWGLGCLRLKKMANRPLRQKVHFLQKRPRDDVLLGIFYQGNLHGLSKTKSRSYSLTSALAATLDVSVKSVSSLNLGILSIALCNCQNTE